jgi:hypothetical protein
MQSLTTSHPEPTPAAREPQQSAERELLAFRSSVTILDVRLLLALILNERGVRVSFRIGDGGDEDEKQLM